MSPITKHILITLLLCITGWFYIAEFKSLLIGHIEPSSVHRIDYYGAFALLIIMLLYSRKLLYGDQPKYKIVIGSVVLGYALVWICIFLLKRFFSGIAVIC